VNFKLNITTDGTQKSPENAPTALPLDSHQKDVIRSSLIVIAKSLEGIPYDIEDGIAPWTGKGKWIDLTKLPTSLDCSGLASGICHKGGLKFPEGSQNQLNFTIATTTPKPGDFAFFGKDKNINDVYHVGMVLDQVFMIEARAKDTTASFETGKVILRPRVNWENWKNFLGYRCHPLLV